MKDTEGFDIIFAAAPGSDAFDLLPQLDQILRSTPGIVCVLLSEEKFETVAWARRS